MLAVGFAGGAILKAQSKMFYIEQSVTNKQQEELEKMSDSKNSFFASMSHEIRTPINTIIGLNEMILRESEEDKTRSYALNIQNASKMLLSLVNDILDLSQMEMKKMEIIPMEYRTEELFENLIDMIQIRLKEKKLEFEKYPTYKRAYIRAFKKMNDRRIECGKNPITGENDPMRVFKWWMEEDFNQLTLEETKEFLEEE